METQQSRIYRIRGKSLRPRGTHVKHPFSHFWDPFLTPFLTPFESVWVILRPKQLKHMDPLNIGVSKYDLFLASFWGPKTVIYPFWDLFWDPF